jgi:hypothetical protein
MAGWSSPLSQSLFCHHERKRRRRRMHSSLLLPFLVFGRLPNQAFQPRRSQGVPMTLWSIPFLRQVLQFRLLTSRRFSTRSSWSWGTTNYRFCDSSARITKANTAATPALKPKSPPFFCLSMPANFSHPSALYPSWIRSPPSLHNPPCRPSDLSLPLSFLPRIPVREKKNTQNLPTP